MQEWTVLEGPGFKVVGRVAGERGSGHSFSRD